MSFFNYRSDTTREETLKCNTQIQFPPMKISLYYFYLGGLETPPPLLLPLLPEDDDELELEDEGV